MTKAISVPMTIPEARVVYQALRDHLCGSGDWVRDELLRLGDSPEDRPAKVDGEVTRILASLSREASVMMEIGDRAGLYGDPPVTTPDR